MHIANVFQDCSQSSIAMIKITKWSPLFRKNRNVKMLWKTIKRQIEKRQYVII